MIRFIATCLAATAAAGAPSADSGVARARAKLDKEPGAQEVVEKALEHFRVDPGMLDGMRIRAKARGLLPLIAGGFRYDANTTDESQTGLYTASPVDLSDKSDARTRAFSIGAVWDLREIVFNPAEAQVFGLVGVQRDLMLEVTRAYFQRRQLYLRLMVQPPDDPVAEDALRMRVEELTAQLDAMTGGWFSKAAKS